MPAPQHVYIAVIGVGTVGKCFLAQLSDLASRFSQNPSTPIYISLVLLSRSKKLLLAQDVHHPIKLSAWESDLEASTTPPKSPTEIAEWLSSAQQKVILVDNTSSEEVASAYPAFLQKGINIVTPNKKGFSGSVELWRDIYNAASNGAGTGGFMFFESACGAGLPVISTLKELIDTGDEIKKIEGVFSGTMSFLFNSFMPVSGGAAGKWSDEVKKAKEAGYTEPDPRDDLNGLDVARKLTILARLSHLEVESPTSFPVQSLIPKELESAKSGDEFLSRLPEFDGEMEKLKQEAEKEGKVLRFVGSIDVEKKDVKVGLEKFDKASPIANLKGSDNIISFYTKRYSNSPLIIQGAGAGGEVTAMGVTGDLVKVLRLLG